MQCSIRVAHITFGGDRKGGKGLAFRGDLLGGVRNCFIPKTAVRSVVQLERGRRNKIQPIDPAELTYSRTAHLK